MLRQVHSAAAPAGPRPPHRHASPDMISDWLKAGREAPGQSEAGSAQALSTASHNHQPVFSDNLAGPSGSRRLSGSWLSADQRRHSGSPAHLRGWERGAGAVTVFPGEAPLTTWVVPSGARPRRNWNLFIVGGRLVKAMAPAGILNGKVVSA